MPQSKAVQGHVEHTPMIYIFGDCELDVERCELWRAGAMVTVEPKVFKVLAHLVVHRDRVVTKDELLERFWPGTFVSESALTRCLTKVRQAVHDDRLSQRVIKTVRGHGYRFVAEVSARGWVPATLPAQANTPAPPPLPSTPIRMAADGPTSHGVLPMERKDVTALAAGLRGATTLAQAVAAEVLHDTLQRALALMRGEVERFGGVVIHRTGDHLTALFGTPIAQEDHTIRALHAALGIQQVFARYAEELQRTRSITLELGMGLATGTVAVGTCQHDTCLGCTTQGFAIYLADRLQTLAAGSTIHVSEAVRQQAVGFFRFKDVGEFSLPEIVQPVRVYACCGLEPATSRLEATLRRHTSRFLGREREIDVLCTLWTRARRGQGQVVVLFGEAGVGKSRLAYEFQRSLADGHKLQAQTLSYGHAMPYHTVIPLIRTLLEPPDHGTFQHQRQHLRSRLAAIHPSLADDAPLLAQLLGVSHEEDQRPALPPEEQKRRIQRACLHVLAQQAVAQPLCIIIEDLHWLDRSSQEFLDLLVASLARVPILLLGTARPGIHDTWGGHTFFHRLMVEPLPDAHTDSLVDDYFRPYAAAAALKALIRERTAGNPFFVEEMLHTLQERELIALQDGLYVLKPGAHLDIPASVHGVLAARVDRLPAEERRLIQTAAVIGMEIPFPILRAIADLPEDALAQSIVHLQAAEFLQQTHPFLERVYTFKHALTQEVAYDGLPRGQRRALHARIVEAIEALPAGRLTNQVEQLAHHAYRAEVWEKAVTYARQAGAKAVAESAYEEAVVGFEQALAALRHLPERRDTYEQAIELQFDLRHALVPLGEGERILTCLRQAEALAATLDDPHQLGRVSCYMAHQLWWNGENARAVELGRRALALAASVGDLSLQVTARFYLGRLYHALGDYREAIDLLRQNVGLLKGDLLCSYFGMAALPAVQSRTWLAWCLGELGLFAEGIECGAAGVEIGEAVNRPHDLLFAYRGLSYLYLLQGEFELAIPFLTRGLSLCQDSNLPVYFPGFAALLGYAYALSGRTGEAIRLLEQAVQHAVSRRTMTYRALFVTWLGEAYRQAGQLDQARQLASCALQLSRDHHERGHEARALLLLGDIAAQPHPSHTNLAEDCYRQALALTKALGMRPLLAHCHLGIGTLYAHMGWHEQAHAALSGAIELYRAMGMTSWLAGAEVVLAQMA